MCTSTSIDRLGAIQDVQVAVAVRVQNHAIERAGGGGESIAVAVAVDAVCLAARLTILVIAGALAVAGAVGAVCGAASRELFALARGGC